MCSNKVIIIPINYNYTVKYLKFKTYLWVDDVDGVFILLLFKLLISSLLELLLMSLCLSTNSSFELVKWILWDNKVLISADDDDDDDEPEIEFFFL